MDEGTRTLCRLTNYTPRVVVIWLAGWVVGWLVGWLVGWVGWLGGWVGWLVSWGMGNPCHPWRCSSESHMS